VHSGKHQCFCNTTGKAADTRELCSAHRNVALIISSWCFNNTPETGLWLRGVRTLSHVR